VPGGRAPYTARRRRDRRSSVSVGTAGHRQGVTPAELRELGTACCSPTPTTCSCDLATRSSGARRATQVHGLDGPIVTDSGGFQVFSLGFGSSTASVSRSACFLAKLKCGRAARQRVSFAVDEDGAHVYFAHRRVTQRLTPETSCSDKRHSARTSSSLSMNDLAASRPRRTRSRRQWNAPSLGQALSRGSDTRRPGALRHRLSGEPSQICERKALAISVTAV